MLQRNETQKKCQYACEIDSRFPAAEWRIWCRSVRVQVMQNSITFTRQFQETFQKNASKTLKRRFKDVFNRNIHKNSTIEIQINAKHIH